MREHTGCRRRRGTGCAVEASGYALIGGRTVGLVGGVCDCSTDTDAEINIVLSKAVEAGADAAVKCEHWAKGGAS